MKLIDMHCDTLWKLMDLDKKGDLMENACSISIPYMKKARSKAQFFACFTYIKDYESNGGYDKAYEHVFEMIAYMNSQLAAYDGEISMARSYAEMENNAAEGRISAFLTVEEGGILNGQMKRLEDLYGSGIRLMTLMWNYENCIGYPASKDASVMWQGLKPFGIEVARRMNELGMIIDLSHASDGTFRDVLEYAAKGPVVASHSNCRAIADHPRNLSDEMIRRLANAGGVAGLNFYGPFLGNDEESGIDQVVAHILHMIRTGGSEFPAIGTDFDGFDGMKVMEVPDISQMERLWDAIKKAGVGERQLDKLWGGNVERILKYI